MTLARFAVAAILARRLSTEAFGQYVYVQWLVDIGFLTCTLGAAGVASRYFAEYRSQPRVLAAIARRWRPLSIGLPLAGAAATAGGVWLSGMPIGLSGYLVVLAWGIASGLSAMNAAALTGLQRFDLVFLANLLASVVMVVGAVLAPLEHEALSVVSGLMALAAGTASLVGLRSIAAISGPSPEHLDATHTRSIYRYALNMWVTALLASLVWSRGEVPILREIQGDAGVARYSVALTLYGGAVAGVMLGVSGVAQQITRLWGDGQLEAAVSLCRKAMDIQLLLAGLGALFLICFSPEIMRWGFGAKYQDSAPLLAVLALGLPALTVASHNHLLQIITGARYTRDTTLAGVVLLCGLSWVGIQTLGVAGAAWSRSTTLMAIALFTVVVCWRKWGALILSRANIAWAVILPSLSVWVCSLPTFYDSVLARLLAFCVCTAGLTLAVRNESGAVASGWILLLRQKF